MRQTRYFYVSLLVKVFLCVGGSCQIAYALPEKAQTIMLTDSNENHMESSSKELDQLYQNLHLWQKESTFHTDRTILDRVVHVCQKALDASVVSPHLLELKVAIFNHFVSYEGNIKRGESELEDIQLLLQKTVFLTPLAESLYLTNLALLKLKNRASTYEDGLKLFQKSLQLLNPVSGPTSEKLRILTNMAQIYYLQGDMSNALQTLEKMDTIYHESLSPIMRSFYFFVKASIFYAQGEFPQAYQAILSAESLEKTIPETGLYFWILNHKAQVLIEMGKFKEARDILQNTQEKATLFFKSDQTILHSTFFILDGLVQARLEGSFKEAEAKIQKGIQLYKSFQKTPQPSLQQAFSYRVLGQVYQLQGDLKSATVAYKKSLSIYHRILKDRDYFALSELTLHLKSVQE